MVRVATDFKAGGFYFATCIMFSVFLSCFVGKVIFLGGGGGGWQWVGSFQVRFWGALTHEYCSLYVKAHAVIIKAVRVTVVALLWYKQERRLMLHAHYANKRGGNCPCYALSGELCPLVWLWPLNGCDRLICDTEMVGAPCVKVTLLGKQRCSPVLPSRPNVLGPWLLSGLAEFEAAWIPLS